MIGAGMTRTPSPFHAAQSLALAAYRVLARTPVLSSRPGRRAFIAAYFAYKRWFEAGDVAALRRFVRPGSAVVDVGANLGFFTTIFARWLTPPSRVVAIEPEPGNVELLRRRVERAGLLPSVLIVEGAAAEATGPLSLVINPLHPGDHRLGAEGLPIDGHALDDLLPRLGVRDVSLIKIDVQGAELRALRGARETLRRLKPAVFVEIDDGALQAAGASAAAVIAFLAALGYRMLVLRHGDWAPVASYEQAARLRRRRGYADYLFVAGDMPTT
jgi:FkbM family methyltransferase